MTDGITFTGGQLDHIVSLASVWNKQHVLCSQNGRKCVKIEVCINTEFLHMFYEKTHQSKLKFSNISINIEAFLSAEYL